MPAYLVHNGTLTDPEGYEEYKSRAEKIVAAHGGRYVARGGASEVMEGDWMERFVLVEFPTYAEAREFYYSSEYQALSVISDRTSISSTAIVDGIPPTV